MAFSIRTWTLASVSGALILAGHTLAGDNVATGIAERMTREALAAGAAGEMELREDLLQQALRVAPDHAPARWARGEMERDGEWKSIGAIQEESRADKDLQEYPTRKAEATTPAAHLEIAKWCDRNGLTDEARYHWLNLLSADPQNKDALRALDAGWFEGQLFPRDQVSALKVERRERRKAEGAWRARITGWDRMVAAGGDEAARALADIEAAVDETAIAEFEKLAATLSDSKDRDHEQTVQLCESYLLALGRLPSYESTSSLTRFAVLANDESLRAMAAEQLQSRPTYEYVPALIEGLTSKLERKSNRRSIRLPRSEGHVRSVPKLAGALVWWASIRYHWPSRTGTRAVPSTLRGLASSPPALRVLRRRHAGVDQDWHARD